MVIQIFFREIKIQFDLLVLIIEIILQALSEAFYLDLSDLPEDFGKNGNFTSFIKTLVFEVDSILKHVYDFSGNMIMLLDTILIFLYYNQIIFILILFFIYKKIIFIFIYLIEKFIEKIRH